MRVFVVAVLLLLAIVGVGLFLWLGSPASVASQAAAPAPSPAQQSIAAPDATPVAPASITRQEVAGDNNRVATPTPAPKPRQGIEEVGAAPVGVDFKPKYANAAREQLLDKLTQLEGEVEQASSKLFVERFAANAFTTHPIASNDARSVDEIVESLTSENELCSTRLVVGDAGRDSANVRPHAVQIVCLRRAEFPELYTLADERDWLRDFVAQTAPTDR